MGSVAGESCHGAVLFVAPSGTYQQSGRRAMLSPRVAASPIAASQSHHRCRGARRPPSLRRGVALGRRDGASGRPRVTDRREHALWRELGSSVGDAGSSIRCAIAWVTQRKLFFRTLIVPRGCDARNAFSAVGTRLAPPHALRGSSHRRTRPTSAAARGDLMCQVGVHWFAMSLGAFVATRTHLSHEVWTIVRHAPHPPIPHPAFPPPTARCPRRSLAPARHVRLGWPGSYR